MEGFSIWQGEIYIYISQIMLGQPEAQKPWRSHLSQRWKSIQEEAEGLKDMWNILCRLSKTWWQYSECCSNTYSILKGFIISWKLRNMTCCISYNFFFSLSLSWFQIDLYFYFKDMYEIIFIFIVETVLLQKIVNT